ncbi:MAG: hypothetical protein ACYC5Y_10800 [Symbiobacteriia bacterium]
MLELAALVRDHNAATQRISEIIRRPALTGHIGDFIAAEVFDIELEPSASSKGIDGYFRRGPLVGQSVNVRFYLDHDGLLGINPDAVPDYFLVLAGSKGSPDAWRLTSVFLLEGDALVSGLRRRGVRIGNATSISRPTWNAAEIFPSTDMRGILVLSPRQQEVLGWFGYYPPLG